MPLYEYECQQCHQRLEKIQKFSDPLLTTCESCGGALKKLLSAPAIQFKGQGWYVTDYAGKGKADQKAEKGAEKAGDGGEAKKSEKKESGGKKDAATASKSSKD